MSLALHPRRLLPCLIAALLVTAVVPSSVPTAVVVADSGTGATAEFGRNVYHEQRGDVAEISVALSGTATATVRLGTDESNRSATVRVRDADHDGQVAVRANTYDATYHAGDGDTLTVRESANSSGPLATGTYDLTVWAGNETAEKGSDIATLSVGERSTDSLRTWVAPKSADLSNLTDVEAAKDSGNLTRSSLAATGDTLVLELRASGIEGAIAAQNESNVTAGFFEFLGSESASLVVPGSPPGVERERGYLYVTDFEATTVVADPENDSYYFVVDLGDVPVTNGYGDTPAANQDVEDQYRANLTLPGRFGATGERESVTAEFEVEHRTASLETPKGTHSVLVAPAPNQTVRGTTTLAPGSRVRIRVHDEIGTRFASKTVRVRNGTGPESRFSVTFSFGQAREDKVLVLTVGVPGGEMLVGSRSGQEGTRGEVRFSRASVNLTDRDLTASRVVVANARLSHGGWVVVHRESADGEVLGRSQRLAPGDVSGRYLHFDAPLESNTTLVAVAHHDGPGDSLGEPYTENGTVVTDSVRFATTAETTTRTTTETAQTTRTTTTTESPTETTDSPMVEETARTSTHPSPGVGTPGFGVGVAVLAVLAGGLLAGRRTDRRS